MRTCCVLWDIAHVRRRNRASRVLKQSVPWQHRPPGARGCPRAPKALRTFESILQAMSHHSWSSWFWYDRASSLAICFSSSTATGWRAGGAPPSPPLPDVVTHSSSHAFNVPSNSLRVFSAPFLPASAAAYSRAVASRRDAGSPAALRAPHDHPPARSARETLTAVRARQSDVVTSSRKSPNHSSSSKTRGVLCAPPAGTCAASRRTLFSARRAARFLLRGQPGPASRHGRAAP